MNFKSDTGFIRADEWFAVFSKEDWKQTRVCNPMRITEDQYIIREAFRMRGSKVLYIEGVTMMALVSMDAGLEVA
jgi:hypothetical protein